MRKGFDGLAVLVQQVLEQSPHSGALFAFRGKRGDLVKLLWYDGQGLCLFSKRIAKGRSSRKIQQEFEHIRKRFWGQRFWARGYFSTTSGNITDDVIMSYLEKHTVPSKTGFSPMP